jgi:outer membrane receptor protein involved in Fe transport
VAQAISPVVPIRISTVAPLDLVYQQFGFPGVPAGAPDLLSGPTLLGPTFETEFTGRFRPTTDIWADSWALYGEAYVQVTDALRLTAGLRYEEEDRTFNVVQQNRLLNPNIAATLTGTSPNLVGGIAAAIAPGFATSNCPRLGLNLVTCAGAIGVNGYRPNLNGVLFNVLGNNFFNQITQNDVQADRVWVPRFGARLKAAEDVTLGLSAQCAYRAGGQGINPVRAAIFNYDAKYSWNNEFSFRALMFDKRLLFTLNAFLINWRDQQLEVALSQAVQDSQVLNLGRSRLYGAEAELLFRASRELTLFGSLGLLSTRIRNDARTIANLRLGHDWGKF